jgi:hypothetical protein
VENARCPSFGNGDIPTKLEPVNLSTCKRFIILEKGTPEINARERGCKKQLVHYFMRVTEN